MKLSIAIIVLLTSGPFLLAQHEADSHAAPAGASHENAIDTSPHPVLPANADWTGKLVFLIAAMFVLAMIIGPIVRASTPEEVPPAHSHDEPPGTSGHHGHSGTVDTHPPEEKHGHGH